MSRVLYLSWEGASGWKTGAGGELEKKDGFGEYKETKKRHSPLGCAGLRKNACVRAAWVSPEVHGESEMILFSIPKEAAFLD